MRMGKQKSRKTGNKSEQKINDPAVKLAIIGGIFAVITTLITALIAPIVIERVKQTQAPAVLLTPQTPQNQNDNTPTLQQTAPSRDWTELLDVRVALPLDTCPIVAFPPNANPEKNQEQAASFAAEAKQSGEVDRWPIVGEDPVDLEVTFTSLPQNANWVKLSNSIDVIVKVNRDMPEHLHALLLAWGCGGGGSTRSFSNISLSDNNETYRQKSTTSEFDFFTLQPGEFEVFSLPFDCEATGIYSIVFELPYTLLDGSGIVTFQWDRLIICPKSYTSWAFEEKTFIFADKYIWDDQSRQYQFVP
jgi:hypothetical protein